MYIVYIRWKRTYYVREVVCTKTVGSLSSPVPKHLLWAEQKHRFCTFICTGIFKHRYYLQVRLALLFPWPESNDDFSYHLVPHKKTIFYELCLLIFLKCTYIFSATNVKEEIANPRCFLQASNANEKKSLNISWKQQRKFRYYYSWRYNLFKRLTFTLFTLEHPVFMTPPEDAVHSDN